MTLIPQGVSFLAFAATLSLAGGACSPPEAVKDPTWADVYPILQGQCLNCHGSTAAADGGGYRFDFLDAVSTCKQQPDDDLPLGLVPAPSFMAARKLIRADVVPFAEGLRPKMPPEPARLLEGWQLDTLKNFIAKLDALPAESAVQTGLGPLPADARSPQIKMTFARLGDEVTVSYVVDDENADPVIGKLRVGTSPSQSIGASGRGQAVFKLTGVVTPASIEARLCDGWNVRTRGTADGLPLVP